MTAVIYGSTTGNTEAAAGKIAEEFGGGLVVSVSDADAASLNGYDTLIFGTSTWGIGDLQDDWESRLDLLDDIDYAGKTVALFGLGDQEGYPDSFADGIAFLKSRIEKNGGVISGSWSSEGYSFDSSRALEGTEFAGLVLDEDNQSALTESRIKAWVQSLAS